MTNVHAAPCHKPAIVIVRMRLRYIRLPAFAAFQGAIEVIAEPARERNVPALPELLQGRRAQWPVEFFLKRYPRSAATPMAMSL